MEAREVIEDAVINLRFTFHVQSAFRILFTSTWAPTPAYAELMRAAEGTAPRLLESEANVRAAQTQAEQAGARPNPTLDFLSENIGSRSNGVAEQQNTLTLSQPLELALQLH